jgi:hypothetical protein
MQWIEYNQCGGSGLTVQAVLVGIGGWLLLALTAYLVLKWIEHR